MFMKLSEYAKITKKTPKKSSGDGDGSIPTVAAALALFLLPLLRKFM